MKDYFLLQGKMVCRKLSDFGLNPLIGALIALAGFVLLSEYAFHKTTFAGFLILLASQGAAVSLSEKRRTDFLKMLYGDHRAKRLRVAENLIICLPFVLVLIAHKAYLEAALSALLGVPAALGSFRAGVPFTLPTPFYKRPFEFIVGFRNTFYIFPVAYLLTIIAVSVDNFNLGIFSLVLVFLTVFSYYQKPEQAYYVWMHSAKPGPFLFGKMKTALLFTAFPALPVCLILAVVYPENMVLTLIAALIGFAFLMLIILAKYAAYPAEMNLPEGIMIALCLIFPPLLLGLIPFFYRKAVNKLTFLLK